MNKGLVVVDAEAISDGDKARLEAAGYMVITKTRGSDFQVIRSPYPSAALGTPWNDPEVRGVASR